MLRASVEVHGAAAAPLPPPAAPAPSFVLHKPGIYASATLAPCLLNLTVDTATAYDEVWMEALEKINKVVRRHDPNSWPLSVDDILSALQRARARDG